MMRDSQAYFACHNNTIEDDKIPLSGLMNLSGASPHLLRLF